MIHNEFNSELMYAFKGERPTDTEMMEWLTTVEKYLKYYQDKPTIISDGDPYIPNEYRVQTYYFGLDGETECYVWYTDLKPHVFFEKMLEDRDPARVAFMIRSRMAFYVLDHELFVVSCFV